MCKYSRPPDNKSMRPADAPSCWGRSPYAHSRRDPVATQVATDLCNGGNICYRGAEFAGRRDCAPYR